MTYTYDPSTDIGRMRRTLPDRDAANAVFSDQEMSSFLADEGDWRRGTALALETVATDITLTLRVTETLGLKVDGARASDALLKRATALRQQADDADARGGGLIDYAEMVTDDFSARERIANELMRSGV